ncbi:MAG: mannose-6-phosphate isomerase [Bacteroidetes bacterium]|nr:mannose-6-phosphate isomerase [Bacteroidota bacterium]
MNSLYPLKFKPIFKERIWGGAKIRTKLGLDFGSMANCGEAWVISGVDGFESKVINGFLKGNNLNELVEVYMDDLLGEKTFNKYREEFPILVKFIDANDFLSIQVHPDDALAAKRKIGGGKTEMWYILEADKEAELITGFSRKVDADTYIKYLKDKKLPEILNFEKVKEGDVFYIPSGRVHALGPGILLAEIQQTSDTTYRIYDWGRVDAAGKSRELHTELALEAIDFNIYDTYRNTYSRKENMTTNLVDCPYFITNFLTFNQEIRKDYTYLDSFVIYVITEGSALLSYESGVENLRAGEAILLPAVMEKLTILPTPKCKFLEIYEP